MDMNKTTVPQDKELVAAVFRLLQDQNKLAEKTGNLLEAVLQDMHKYREQSERFIQLESKLDSIGKSFNGFEKRCKECASECEDRFKELEKRREENKDKITELTLVNANNFGVIKELLNEKLEKTKTEFAAKHEILAKDVATTAGKYGGLVAVILSLLMMLLQWVITHAPKHTIP